MYLALLITILSISIVLISLHPYIGRNGCVGLLLGFNLLFCFLYVFSYSADFFLILIVEWLRTFLVSNFLWGFHFDFFSIHFIFLIILITTLVCFFSISYMFYDTRFVIFLGFLEFFMFFMCVLVSSSNLIQLFIGWEGVGIVSFLLINFWFYRLDANKGALKALILNRIGDVGYLLFVVLVLVWFGSGDIFVCFFSFDFVWFTLVFFALAVFGKSAQLVLYAWLPDAMEGPTPVSSLLHSATMVTAGVFLLLRLHLLFDSFSVFLYILVFIGGLTSVCTGLMAFQKFDIKKVVAFSTCSQLGLMVCGIGVGCFDASFFHLCTHAFFKCLLFVSSGVVIHSLVEEQDLRRMAGSFYQMPLFYFFTVVGSLSMVGFLFFSGFYSKDILLISSLIFSIPIFKGLILISSVITILYSIRLLFFCFGVDVSNFVMIDFYHLFSLVFLTFGAIFVGYFISDFFLGFYHLYVFDLVSYSFFLLFFVGVFYFLVIYIYIFQKLSFLLKAGSFFSVEFYIPVMFWACTFIINKLFYRVLVNVFDRSLLDVLTFVFPTLLLTRIHLFPVLVSIIHILLVFFLCFFAFAFLLLDYQYIIFILYIYLDI